MNKQQIIELIKSGEGQTIEFKERLNEEVAKTACAFSNTNKGYILIGIADSGTIIGSSDREERAAQLISAISPRIYPRIYRVQFDKKTIIVIEIEKAAVLTTYKNVPYVRIAATTQSLSFAEALAFAYGKGVVTFDEVTNPEIKLAEIDNATMDFYRIEMEHSRGKKFSISKLGILESIGCIKNGKLTNGGALLFSKNPQKYYQSAYISIARYEGSDVGDRYTEIKQFYGNIFQQINEVSKYLEEHNQKASFLEGVMRVDVPLYSSFALRELLINAIAHRDYSAIGSHITIKWFSNRIEYYNPGGLVPPVTVDTILKKQKSRNPLIVDVLHRAGYIESLGDGLDRVFVEIKKHPLQPSPPKFEDLGDAFIATMYAANLNLLKYHNIVSEDRRYRDILAVLTENSQGAGVGQLALKMSISTDTAHRLIKMLIKKGVLKRYGIGRSTIYKLA